MRMRFILSVAAVLLAGLLNAGEYDYILLFKNCGTWKNNASVIQSGLDKGRVAWDGKTLKFTPPGGKFDLKNIYCFGFAVRAPEDMLNQPFSVKFVYDEGQPVIWNLRTPPHPGWLGRNAQIQADRWPRIRPGKIKAVEFSAADPGFKAFLDDIRFVPQGLRFKFEEDWVQPLTSGCYFPEYTLEQQRKETLEDPEFEAKMAELEKLRQAKLKIQLKPQHTTKENLQGIPEIARIRDDGSVEGWSYEDASKFHIQRRYWHNTNETFMEQICYYYNNLLVRWEWGRVPRTEENRKKLFRSLIRTMTAETNRREECTRSIIPGFVMPTHAAMVYRVFFDEMDAVEKGISRDPDSIKLNRLLKEVVSWCFFHGFHHTVGPAITVQSFSRDSDWTGGNFSYRPTFWAALICRNPKILDVISEVAKNALTVTSYNTMKKSFWLDAMTADGSAWGHHNQNYPFGYPLSGILGIGNLIRNLSGTRWAVKMDGPASENVCRYLEALLWHGTGWAENDNKNVAPVGPLLQRDIPAACGRRSMIYREGRGYADFGRYILKSVECFRDLMPEGSEQRKRLQHCYDVIIGNDRNLPVGTRYFWNNDMLLCREKDSLVSISMLSSRVLSIESAPSNSHLTDFFSDGAAWIMKHYDSYRIARGFLKPYAIPGVTSRQWEFDHKSRFWRSYPGLHNFAGGAADGNYAVCGYRMGRKRLGSSPDPNFYDLDAEKSYFWLNGKLVCLGTGITDRAQRNVPVATTLDQTLWRGPAAFGPGTTRKPGETFQADTQLLQHDGVGYAVLNGKGKLSGETRKDRWLDFDGNNRSAEKLPKTAPMLMFQIEHGQDVINGSYAYMVDFHSPDFASLKKLVQQPPFEIVSAASDAHVVREKSSGTLAGVFFRAGKVGGLSVDTPAVVLLRQTPEGIRVTVNDPEQDPKRESVMLGWDGKHYKINLPSGVYCGQPVTVNLNELKPMKKEEIMKRTAIVLAMTAALCCPAQNLFKNGDFQSVGQDGKLTNWKYNPKEYSLVQSDRPGETGKKVVMVKLALPEGKPDAKVNAYLAQRLQLKPGKYQLAVTGKVIGQGVVNCSWAFIGQDGKRMKMKAPWWSKACQGASWQTTKDIIEVPEGTKFVDFLVTSYVAGVYKQKAGTMFIASVVLTPAE